MPSAELESVQMFREIIRSSTPVIVLFYLGWSVPCQQIAPLYEKLSAMPELDTLRFYRVEIDHNPDISAYCQIGNVPAFAIYQNGTKMSEVIGSHKSGIQGLLKKYLR
ncbi:thioredoxin-like protein [Pholiota conissans]|uniref:Thioredoxin-like protein n=1 Tax=Pholiota conissans TaxID=109636 RepID=A0A9P6CT34_9AGAR|nr:thioredoxin-like protein [Pholiota conissans]